MGPRAPLAGLFRAGWSFHWKWFPQREPNKFGFIQHRAFTKGGSVSDSNAPEEGEGKVHFFYAAVASCDGIGIGLRGPSQAIHWLLGYCWYIRSAFCWWETQGRGTVCRSLTADVPFFRDVQFFLGQGSTGSFGCLRAHALHSLVVCFARRVPISVPACGGRYNIGRYVSGFR